ncbi:Inositol 2-dehydrogenase [Maioricimonas rarisocia]|uniref:Inositol 2-dehydrogenase n=1 Tax=Maioricimonas rarisocia TaxID=2528026 RepID=A0A517Z7V1_9PLAN|nr:Gfo/Idh/MocA family oxidoreductase [Maioricimonas rarisocia]QDU38562.1 Inositol 2-dehydrogenase [Maioricimonas rarisocia]
MPRHDRLTRRGFLAQSATAAGAVLAAPALLPAAAPSETVNLAFIGAGGRGGRNLKTMTSQGHVDVNVVALCDVNGANLDRAASMFPKARKYVDFRKLFEKTDDIDAVVVSTTEHTHAYATMPALQLGKHVYCEKPLTHNVHESRRVMEAAAAAGVATQMGTQIHGMPNYRRVVELIQSGAIGPVREAHVWVSRAWGLQSKEEAEKNRDIVHVTDRPKEAMTPPDHLDWDLWIGPAPYRPYHEVYFPGPKWYRWWDFGNGTMSDLGSHWNDLPFWALKLDAPKTIEAFGPEPHPEIAPASMSAVYEYGPRGEMPACTLTWYQGDHKPKIWQEGGIPQWGNGVLFVGDKGMLLSDYGKHVLLPEKEFADYERPEPFIPDSPGQHEEWLIACKTGAETGSPFSYAGPLTEANHLGNVAFRAGRKLQWDAKSMRATNCPEADQYLGREPRKGWSLG